MTLAARPTWIRGAARTPRYVGVGKRAASLYRAIDDLPGRRGAVERAAMRTIGRRGVRPALEPEVTEAWSRLLAAPDVVGPVRSALFVYTGFYKDTVLTGVVDTGVLRFVKVFRDPKAGAAEEAKRRALAPYVSAPTVLAPLVHASDGLVVYELLERADRSPALPRLEAAAEAIGRAALADASRRDERAAVTLGSVVSARLAEIGEPHGAAAAAAIDTTEVPLAVAHGDFTPWNTFGLADGRLALVDYERVGERAPFTDVWHLRTQRAALAGRPGTAAAAIDDVAAAAGVAPSTAAMWYLTYVLEELRQDLADWFDNGRRHHQLRTLISVRSGLLDRTGGHR